MKVDLKYLFSKTWFLIIFAGFLGLVNITFDILISRIVVAVLLSASFMYVGLIVGFNLGSSKKS